MAQRVRFTKEIIDLFEALAPDTEEVLAEIGQMSDAELEQELAPVKDELEKFLKKVHEKFGKK